MATNISNWTQLAAMNDNLADDYVLTADLSSTTPDYDTIGNNWLCIGWDKYTYGQFTGTFDGQGHTISDIIGQNLQEFGGLFGTISGATIQNLIIADSSFTPGSHGGIFVGESTTVSSTIKKCFARNCSVVNSSYSGHMGGLIGYMDSSCIIEDCGIASDCVVTGNSLTAGGFAGTCVECTIDRCYTAATVSGGGTLQYYYGCGGLVGYCEFSTLKNSFSAATVNEGPTIAGGFIGFADTPNYTNCAWLVDGDLSAVGDLEGGGAVATLAENNWGTDETTASDFYSKDHPVYDQGGSDPWDFTAPAVWYEWNNTYPKLYKQPSSRTRCGIPMFFRPV